MRKLLENQLKIGQVDICNIPIDLHCRDEIPQFLLGLQAIYSNTAVREQVFCILGVKSSQKTSTRKTAGPGMDLWKIFVLGVVRLNYSWDFDKVHDIANNHKLIREFMGLRFLILINVMDFRPACVGYTIPRNVQKIGAVLRQKALKRMKRQNKSNISLLRAA